MSNHGGMHPRATCKQIMTSLDCLTVSVQERWSIPVIAKCLKGAYLCKQFKYIYMYTAGGSKIKSMFNTVGVTDCVNMNFIQAE